MKLYEMSYCQYSWWAQGTWILYVDFTTGHVGNSKNESYAHASHGPTIHGSSQYDNSDYDLLAQSSPKYAWKISGLPTASGYDV